MDQGGDTLSQERTTSHES